MGYPSGRTTGHIYETKWRLARSSRHTVLIVTPRHVQLFSAVSGTPLTDPWGVNPPENANEETIDKEYTIKVASVSADGHIEVAFGDTTYIRKAPRSGAEVTTMLSEIAKSSGIAPDGVTELTQLPSEVVAAREDPSGIRALGIQTISIERLDNSDPCDCTVMVNHKGHEIMLHLGHDRFVDKYKIFMSHVDEWEQQFDKLESVDLSSDHQIIVNPDRKVPRNDK